MAEGVAKSAWSKSVKWFLIFVVALILLSAVGVISIADAAYALVWVLKMIWIGLQVFWDILSQLPETWDQVRVE